MCGVTESSLDGNNGAHEGCGMMVEEVLVGKNHTNSCSRRIFVLAATGMTCTLVRKHNFGEGRGPLVEWKDPGDRSSRAGKRGVESTFACAGATALARVSHLTK